MAAGALFEVAVERKSASQLHGKAYTVFKPGIVKGVGEGQTFITGVEVDGAVAAKFMVHIGLQVNDGIRIHLTSQVEAHPSYETGDTGLFHPGAIVHFILVRSQIPQGPLGLGLHVPAISHKFLPAIFSAEGKAGGIHGSGMGFRNGADVRIHGRVGMETLIHVTDAENQVQVVAGLMDIGVVNGGGSSLVGSPAVSIISLAVQIGKGDARETLHAVIVFGLRIITDFIDLVLVLEPPIAVALADAASPDTGPKPRLFPFILPKIPHPLQHLVIFRAPGVVHKTASRKSGAHRRGVLTFIIGGVVCHAGDVKVFVIEISLSSITDFVIFFLR